MKKFPSLPGCLVFLAFLAAGSAFADNIQTTEKTLLDRIQIEDLIASYYWDMTSGGRHELSDYYTEGAILDVNGVIFKGKDIQNAYDGGGADAGARVHMLLNNARIRVNGDSATAEVVWTGVISETVRIAPRLFEQGREYTELKKKDGRWFFSKRVITSDAGLPARYDATYKNR